MKEPNKLLVLITGMHRSGTSFLARALNLGGVSLGGVDSLISSDWLPLKDNPRGHWENKEMLELTKKTFKINQGSWDDVPKKITINEKIGSEIHNSIYNLLQTNYPASGFKDPRIIFVLESWKKYLPRKFVLVGIFRHPLKAAESLKVRDNFSYEKSLNLWKIYNEKLLYLLSKYDGFLLDFDWPKEKLLKETELILQKLELIHDIDLDEWYSEDLFRSDKTFNFDFKLETDILNLYSKLKKRSQENNKVVLKNTAGKYDKSKVMEAFLSELQKQGKFFKEIYNRQNKIIIDHTEWSKQTKAELSNKKAELSNKEAELSNKKAELEKQKDELSNKKAELEKQKDELSNKEAELEKLRDERERIGKRIIGTINKF